MTRYLLDTTVLIDHLRGDERVAERLSALLREGHTLETCCVNVAEIERGLRPAERRAADRLFSRLGFLTTTKEAASRAGRYQADAAKRGRTIHLSDALIAGTARAHGSVVMTNDIEGFPMRDIKVEHPIDAQSW